MGITLSASKQVFRLFCIFNKAKQV